jgi:hypothetical protein
VALVIFSGSSITRVWKPGPLDRLRVNVGGLSDEEIGFRLEVGRGTLQRAVPGHGGRAECGKKKPKDDCLRERFQTSDGCQQKEAELGPCSGK